MSTSQQILAKMKYGDKTPKWVVEMIEGNEARLVMTWTGAIILIEW